VAPGAAVHDSDTCASPVVACRFAGGARFTRSVVASPWLIEPDVPVMASDRAYGFALAVVLMVSVELPEPPVIVAGLNPPFETPVGNPASAPTERATLPVKPESGVTVTVKLVDCPGVIDRQSGLTSMLKFGLLGLTVMTRVGGL
jgi:hypothetical protein